LRRLGWISLSFAFCCPGTFNAHDVNVLIIGTSGHIGCAVTAQVRQAAHSITALVRSEAGAARPQSVVHVRYGGDPRSCPGQHDQGGAPSGLSGLIARIGPSSRSNPDRPPDFCGRTVCPVPASVVRVELLYYRAQHIAQLFLRRRAIEDARSPTVTAHHRGRAHWPAANEHGCAIPAIRRLDVDRRMFWGRSQAPVLVFQSGQAS